MNYLLFPDLVAILWMALVLSRLRSRHATDFLHLWITGLGLIVVEGMARILYALPMSVVLHDIVHVVALDAYYLAGVAFFQSATGRLRYLRNSNQYLVLCIVPSLALVTAYGAGLTGRGLYLTLAASGLATGMAGALLFRRPPVHLLCQLLVWMPVLAACEQNAPRVAAYLLLFDIYGATAIAFACTLPRERWGRAIVIAGFGMWSLCFLTHPWIAVHHVAWLPLASKIWDIQKFMVTFGLLIVTLEEDSAAKEYQALHDTLTGLPNRRLFHDRLTQAIAQAQRKGSRLVLYNIDLDNFKYVNDGWGHDAGDLLLQEVGARLSSVTRQADTLARMGGDEFQLLIQDFEPQLGQAESTPALAARCAQVMESFRQAVEKAPFTLETGSAHQRLQPRLSIGAAIFPDQASTMDELCRLADQNMYADKRRRASATAQGSERQHAMQLTPHSAS